VRRPLPTGDSGGRHVVGAASQGVIQIDRTNVVNLCPRLQASDTHSAAWADETWYVPLPGMSAELHIIRSVHILWWMCTNDCYRPLPGLFTSWIQGTNVQIITNQLWSELRSSYDTLAASSNMHCFCAYVIADSSSSQGETSCAVIISERKRKLNPLIQSVMYFSTFCW